MKLRSIVCLTLTLPLGIALAQVPYPGNDSDDGVARVSGLVDHYTGNLAFSTRDLVVSGAVGSHGLSWSRHTTSRTPHAESRFGLGHNWAHSWQWEMMDAGRDGEGRPVLLVHEPQGWEHRFTETAPGQWTPPPSVRDRVVSEGDSFRVLRLDGGEVRFTRREDRKGRSSNWANCLIPSETLGSSVGRAAALPA